MSDPDGAEMVEPSARLRLIVTEIAAETFSACIDLHGARAWSDEDIRTAAEWVAIGVEELLA